MSRGRGHYDKMWALMVLESLSPAALVVILYMIFLGHVLYDACTFLPQMLHVLSITNFQGSPL